VGQVSEQPPPAPTSGPPPTALPMGYQPPPPPTALPMGYQPPPGPAGPHEPPVDPPIEAYRPIAYQLPPPRTVHPGRIALLALLALVLAVGGATVLFGLADEDPPSAAGPPTAAAAPAPPVTATLDLAWPELTAEPESAEPELHSSQTGAPTVVHFENLSGETVTVSWLDYADTPVRYSDLPDRQGYDQDTYSGHVWVVTRADGSTEMYTASSSPSRVVIR
jgi:hypothetical protein